MASNGKERELILAPQFPTRDYPEVSRVRSTLLAASVQSIRQMGWERRYFDALPAELHQDMRALVAGVWVPIALGFAHYAACDAMRLGPEEIDAMGKAVSERTQKTFVGTLGSVAAGAGATPWHIFRHGHRIWGRIFDGGDHEGYKVGPKDFEITCFGCPLLRTRYFRSAMGAYYAALAGVLSPRVHWRELAGRTSETSMKLRISWV